MSDGGELGGIERIDRNIDAAEAGIGKLGGIKDLRGKRVSIFQAGSMIVAGRASRWAPKSSRASHSQG